MSHVSSLSLVARRIVLPLFLMTGLLVTACGQSGGGSDVPAYDVGASITDSTTALIVESEYGTDTLTAQAFQQRVNFVQQRTPPQDRDEAGLHEQVVNQFMQIHLLTGVVEETDTLSAGSQSIPPAQVERQIEQIRQRFQQQRGQRQNLQNFETLEDFLASQGMTMDSLRASIESRMRQQMDQQRQRQKLQQAQQSLADDAEQPTDAEVASYSEENPRVRAQHILLKAEEDIPQAQDDSIRQRAQVLLDSARMDGVDFAELARRHSEGPSARQGGDLGYFSRDGQMVEPFAEAAFALQDSGDVYEKPVRTQFGYHIIRLSGEAQPMDTSQARSQMMQERRREAYEDGMRDLRAKATLRVNPDVVKFDPQEGLAPDDEEDEQN